MLLDLHATLNVLEYTSAFHLNHWLDQWFEGKRDCRCWNLEQTEHWEDSAGQAATVKAKGASERFGLRSCRTKREEQVPEYRGYSVIDGTSGGGGLGMGRVGNRLNSLSIFSFGTNKVKRPKKPPHKVHGRLLWTSAVTQKGVLGKQVAASWDWTLHKVLAPYTIGRKTPRVSWDRN